MAPAPLLRLVSPTGPPLNPRIAVTERRYSGSQMGRKPKDDDATQNLRPEDKTQRGKAGTKIGLLRKSEVLADFRKIVRGRKN